MAIPTRSEVEAMIAERVAADPSFREALLADPRGVVADDPAFSDQELDHVAAGGLACWSGRLRCN